MHRPTRRRHIKIFGALSVCSAALSISASLISQSYQPNPMTAFVFSWLMLLTTHKMEEIHIRKMPLPDLMREIYITQKRNDNRHMPHTDRTAFEHDSKKITFPAWKSLPPECLREELGTFVQHLRFQSQQWTLVCQDITTRFETSEQEQLHRMFMVQELVNALGLEHFDIYRKLEHKTITIQPNTIQQLIVQYQLTNSFDGFDVDTPSIAVSELPELYV